jgi:hypothetical protein
MRAVDPDLDKRESFLLAAALREAAEGLPEGRRALPVGQPANAAAVPGPADQVIPPIGNGQRGYAVELDGNYRLEPSGRRAGQQNRHPRCQANRALQLKHAIHNNH